MRPIIMWLKREITPKGIRRIPTNIRSLTGEFHGQEFESSLERDLHLIVHYDQRVDWYQSQPVTIDYVDKEGVPRQYTPDLLVMYQDKKIYQHLKPILIEVKYREDMWEQWPELKRKIKAGRAYANEKGWDFKILTEKEIRTPYLKNVKFLIRYRFSEFENFAYEAIMEMLDNLQETDPRTLIKSTFHSQENQGHALWALWVCVARGWIECDLNEPLTMRTRIWKAT